jgi:DUF1680 family protein
MDQSAKPLQAKSFPQSQVRLLDGIFKDRQEVHASYLMSVDPDRLLAPFRIQAGLPAKAERYGGWESRDISGHSLGHYLSALSFLYTCRGDRGVEERVHYIVDELAACQDANGDGYVLPVNKQAFEDLRAGRIAASPFTLNGVWVPFYTQHKVLAGLRDAYRLVNIPKALDIGRKIADWLEAVLYALSADEIQEMLRSEHGGMNEVLADLSSDTADRRYLRMAEKFFHHRPVLDPLFRGEDRLNGLHGNTQIPKVIGLAREYELTGTPSYKVAAESFWHTVVHNRTFATGGHGESEHFFPVEEFPRRLTPNTCETCNTYNMLKLTEHLFSWSPAAGYMDFVERAMINHLAANIGRGPGEFGYFLGLASVGVKVFSTPFDSWWCCVGTGLENPVLYGEQIYSQSPATLWINLYIGSRLTWPEMGIELTQETQFPDGENARFTFSCREPVRLAVKLRHPYWCQKPEMKINNISVTIESQPSSYLEIERQWSDGDTLDLRLPMALHLQSLPHSDGKVVAVMYGPTVLAAVVPDEPGISNPARQRFSEHLNARGKTDAFPPSFVASSVADVLGNLKPTGNAFAEFKSEGIVKPHDLPFVPLYRIYEEQYAVYFPLMTADEWTQREGEIQSERQRTIRLDAATLDSVTPGYQQPEVEHSLRATQSEVEDFSDRKCRLARDGGWFEYEMAVDPGDAMLLTVTYWGGVWHPRTFDLIVDGTHLAAQTLHVNMPGEFFEMTYPIPPTLTSGRQMVAVRFQSRPGDIAGGVFALRMMRT